MSRVLRSAPFCAFLVMLGACRAPSGPSARAGVSAETPPGLADFAFHDFGVLSREGFDRALVPWKLSAAALLIRAERERGHPLTRDSLSGLLREYGFLDARRVGNWVGPGPREAPPALGILTGSVALGALGLRVEGGGIGCAACHSSTLYDATGSPTLEAWIGAPSRAIYLGAYFTDLFSATEAALQDPSSLMARVRREYPETGWYERLALKRLVIPRARKRFRELRSTYGGAVPFSAGIPGHTNGVAAIKYYLAEDRTSVDWTREVGYVGIPDLYARHLRAALLVDGVYRLPGSAGTRVRQAGPMTGALRDSLAPVVTFFAVPALGVAPEIALRHVGRAGAVLDWLEGYRTPPFPGHVDTMLVAAGATLYAAECANCHGTYDPNGSWPRRILEYPNRRVPLAELGTDPVRLALADDRTRDAIERSLFGRLLSVEQGDGYVAPMLSGVWMRAPYLHNGSVPTLWHLLSPDDRPARFDFGGHALDFERLGIALARDASGVWRYPKSRPAWSRPAHFDTNAYGSSNAGHRYPDRRLSDDEKRQLIEYLKTL